MAKESKVNGRRRRLAAQLYRDMAASIQETSLRGVNSAALAVLVCDAADALIHEFDERGWQ